MAESEDKNQTPSNASNESPQTQSSDEVAKNKKSRSRLLKWFTLSLLIIALAWLCYWYFYLQYHETTDDAYANGNLININSVIPGAVVAFFADNTDFVKQGQLLVQLDCISHELTYQKELANLATIALQVRQLYDNVRENQANVKNKQSVLNEAKSVYQDRLHLQLHNPLAVAREDYIQSERNLLVAQFELQKAQSQLEASLTAAGNTPPEKHPLIEQQKENIRTAFYQVQHCSIYSPTDGYVAQRSVDVGEWVTPTVNLMAVIPKDYVWVDANFKETQLSKMRIGQPAVVWFDLYGSEVKYEGKVLGIASGTGSVFSLIPPQNATGNWIKIVQRLPVRISLDPEKVKEFPVRLGISALVDVDVTNQDLPYLATSPPLKPVAQTDVFEINLKEVNQLMEQIVSDNLKQQLLQQSK